VTVIEMFLQIVYQVTSDKVIKYMNNVKCQMFKQVTIVRELFADTRERETHIQRERDRDRDRETDRQTETERQTERVTMTIRQ